MALTNMRLILHLKIEKMTYQKVKRAFEHYKKPKPKSFLKKPR
jgi:hypothetical protein